MKIIFLSLFINMLAAGGFYDLSFTNISGELVPLKQFAGKKVLIVNIATDINNGQVMKLDSLSLLYNDKLTVILVPSNSFGNESKSGTALENYFSGGNSFYVAKKSAVAGNQAHPIYKWLSDPAKAGELAQSVKIDFQKYLIDEKGNLMGVFSSRIDPMGKEIRNLISDIPVEIGAIK